MECVPLGTIIGAGISVLHCVNGNDFAYIFGLLAGQQENGKIKFLDISQLIFPLSPLFRPVKMLSRMICFTTGGNFSKCLDAIGS